MNDQEKLVLEFKQLRQAVNTHQIRYDEIEEKVEELINQYGQSLTEKDIRHLVKELVGVEKLGLNPALGEKKPLKDFFNGEFEEKYKSEFEKRLVVPVDVFIFCLLAEKKCGCRFYIPKPDIPHELIRQQLERKCEEEQQRLKALELCLTQKQWEETERKQLLIEIQQLKQKERFIRLQAENEAKRKDLMLKTYEQQLETVTLEKLNRLKDEQTELSRIDQNLQFNAMFIEQLRKKVPCHHPTYVEQLIAEQERLQSSCELLIQKTMQHETMLTGIATRLSGIDARIRGVEQGLKQQHQYQVEESAKLDQLKAGLFGQTALLERAVQLFEERDSSSVSLSGEEYLRQGKKLEQEQNYSSALSYYQQAVRKGCMAAYTRIGIFYREGLGGIKQDNRKAYDSSLIAAESGHARAMADVGTILINGVEGVPRDRGKALYWLRLAGDKGDDEIRARVKPTVAALELMLSPVSADSYVLGR